MKTKIIEAVSHSPEGHPWNHGKFLIGRFDTEHERKDVSGYALLLPRWGAGPGSHILVLDLETGEGALFRPGGLPRADLDKHRVWVCVLFPAFLHWLYEQDLSDLSQLPDQVDITGVELQLRGYRRPGPNDDLVAELAAEFEKIPGWEGDEIRAKLAVDLIEQRLRERLLQP